MPLSWPWSGLQSQDRVSHSPTSDRRGSDLAARGLYQLVGRIHTTYSPGKAVFIPRSDSRNSELVLGTRAPDWWRIASEAALAKRSETFASHVKLALGTAIVRCQRAIVLADGR